MFCKKFVKRIAWAASITLKRKLYLPCRSGKPPKKNVDNLWNRGTKENTKKHTQNYNAKERLKYTWHTLVFTTQESHVLVFAEASLRPLVKPEMVKRLLLRLGRIPWSEKGCFLLKGPSTETFSFLSVCTKT